MVARVVGQGRHLTALHACLGAKRTTSRCKQSSRADSPPPRGVVCVVAGSAHTRVPRTGIAHDVCAFPAPPPPRALTLTAASCSTSSSSTSPNVGRAAGDCCRQRRPRAHSSGHSASGHVGRRPSLATPNITWAAGGAGGEGSGGGGAGKMARVGGGGRGNGLAGGCEPCGRGASDAEDWQRWARAPGGYAMVRCTGRGDW